MTSPLSQPTMSHDLEQTLEILCSAAARVTTKCNGSRDLMIATSRDLLIAAITFTIQLAIESDTDYYNHGRLRALERSLIAEIQAPDEKIA